MGLFKRGVGKVWHGTTAPARLALPKSVVKQHLAAVDTSKNSSAPYCPSCARSRLYKSTLEYEDLEEDVAVWLCKQCDFKAEVEGDTISDLKDWLQENARSVYEESFVYEQMESQEDYATEARYYRVKKRVYTARIFLGLALLFLPSFIYASFKLNFFLMFNSVLITFCFLFIGAVNGYRAWQIETNSFYAHDGKAQFNNWIKSNNWFAYPVKEQDDD